MTHMYYIYVIQVLVWREVTRSFCVRARVLCNKYIYTLPVEVYYKLSIEGSELGVSAEYRGSSRNKIDDLFSAACDRNVWYKDKSTLDTNLPTSSVIGRNDEIQSLIRRFSGYKYGDLPAFITVRGRSGSGKTTVVTHICRSISSLRFAIVNLRQANTLLGCVNLVLREMGLPEKKSAHGVNGALSSLEQEVERRFKAEEGKAFFVLVLDDFDVFLRSPSSSNPSEIVNRLLGMIEALRKKGVMACIVAITNEPASNFELDDRILSRVNSAVVDFPSYTWQELVEILQDKSHRAFCVMPSLAILQKCASLCCGQYGDARRAVDLLRTAADTAIAKGSVTIMLEDIDSAANRLLQDSAAKTISDLPLQQRILAGIIAWRTHLTREDWHTTNEIFQQYTKILSAGGSGEMPLSYRRVSDLLRELENRGIVYSEGRSQGRYGANRRYRLKLPINVVGHFALGEFWTTVVTAKEDLQQLEMLQQLCNSLEPWQQDFYRPLINAKIARVKQSTLIDTMK